MYVGQPKCMRQQTLRSRGSDGKATSVSLSWKIKVCNMGKSSHDVGRSSFVRIRTRSSSCRSQSCGTDADSRRCSSETGHYFVLFTALVYHKIGDWKWLFTRDLHARCWNVFTDRQDVRRCKAVRRRQRVALVKLEEWSRRARRLDADRSPAAGEPRRGFAAARSIPIPRQRTERRSEGHEEDSL